MANGTATIGNVLPREKSMVESVPCNGLTQSTRRGVDAAVRPEGAFVRCVDCWASARCGSEDRSAAAPVNLRKLRLLAPLAFGISNSLEVFRVPGRETYAPPSLCGQDNDSSAGSIFRRLERSCEPDLDAVVTSRSLQPPLEEVLELGWRTQPELGCSLAALPPDQHCQSEFAKFLHDTKCRFVAKVVAEKGNRNCDVFTNACLGQNGFDSLPFVRSRAQLEAGLKLQKREPAGTRQRLKMLPRPLFNLSSSLAGSSTPMNQDAVGLVFKYPTEGVEPQAVAQPIEPALYLRRALLQFPAAVGMEPLGAVQAPNLEWRVKAEQRDNLAGTAAGDDRHSGAALMLDGFEEFPHAGPGPGLKAIEAEWGQGTVVVEQQKRCCIP